ncbi:hypothetical protein IWX90DRAFT_431976 [Phyllosticta citrichinensis]|uniref:Uncharacterized protein n=1 Tax=Phyllosticta citrichinensis TaxID=1130410 RepID=A0ABR1XXR7_9PEZI
MDDLICMYALRTAHRWMDERTDVLLSCFPLSVVASLGSCSYSPFLSLLWFFFYSILLYFSTSLLLYFSTSLLLYFSTSLLLYFSTSLPSRGSSFLFLFASIRLSRRHVYISVYPFFLI